jgi:hypothetical protein
LPSFCIEIQENIRKQREILAHKYNHAQLQTQENAWMNEMKSLQDKYTRNKTRKLTVLETDVSFKMFLSPPPLDP